MKIKEKSSQKLIYFPKNLNSSLSSHQILLKSELTNKEYLFSELLDKDGLVDYYSFILDITNIPDGEYKYYIDDNDACGLIIIGEPSSSSTSYSEHNNKFIVYGE